MSEAQREEYHVTGDELVRKVKEIIAAGNARSIIIKNEEGKEVIQFPVTVGVVGALVAMPLVAVGAIAAMLTNCTIVVVKR